MSRPTLEIPIDGLAAARFSAPKADRLEVCVDLASEGWTPSRELLQSVVDAVADQATEVVSLIRPQLTGQPVGLEAEHFIASPAILDASLEAIDDAARAGADAVAVGLLTPDGAIDVDACRILRESARQEGLKASFLRMFDLVHDRAKAIEQLTCLGFRRILTAGVHVWDPTGTEITDRVGLLQADVAAARESGKRHGVEPIEIVACGGVRSGNARDFLQATDHLHSSCRISGIMDAEELQKLHAIINQEA